MGGLLRFGGLSGERRGKPRMDPRKGTLTTDFDRGRTTARRERLQCPPRIRRAAVQAFHSAGQEPPGINSHAHFDGRELHPDAGKSRRLVTAWHVHHDTGLWRKLFVEKLARKPLAIVASAVLTSAFV